MSVNLDEPAPCLFVTRAQFQQIFKCGHSRGYKLLEDYGAEVVKQGNRTLIPIGEVKRIAAALPRGIDSAHMAPAVAAKKARREAVKQAASK
jgi:choline dehydrogenase-like flavoprotein